MLTALTGADKIASTDTFLDVCPSVVHCTLAIDILSTGLLSTPGTEQGVTRIKEQLQVSNDYFTDRQHFLEETSEKKFIISA